MRLISIFLIIYISFINCSIGFAQEYISNVKTYPFQEDVKMSGVISGNSKFFDIKDNWNVKSAKLNLVFTKSELLDINYSAITVFINDVPINSQRLDGAKEYKKQTIIDIPVDLIKNDYNKITVKSYKTMSDMICRDDSNTANWLVLHKESNISVEYDLKPLPNLVSNYNEHFINLDNGSRLNTTVVIPDDYSSGELNAGILLSSNFSRKANDENLSFDFKLYSEFTNTNDNIIYIGKKSNTPLEILDLFTFEQKEDLDNTCIIKQVNSIFSSDKKMMVILSNNDVLLKKASNLLISNDLISNLNKDTIIVNKNTDERDIAKQKDDTRMYLEDLGYDNILLKGAFTQEAIMDINVPKDKLVTNGTKIRLNMRYSDNLDFEMSLVTIYVNDVPIGSKKLSKEKSNGDFVEFNLPKEVLGKNYYKIQISFNLNLIDLSCVTREMDMPWAYVSKNSFLSFYYDESNNLSFNTYPYPFVKNNEFNDFNVVVPDNLKSSQLTDIANIISYISRDVYFNTGNFNVIRNKELKSKYKKGNLLVIGTPNDNSIIKEINKNLSVKFNDKYDNFISNDKIKFFDDYSSQVATIQMINSPFDKESGIMAITSVNDNNLYLATKYLSTPKLAQSLKGDAIIIGKDGYIKDLSYYENKKIFDDDIKQVNTLSTSIKIFMIITVFVLITVITSLVFLYKKYIK